MKSICKKCGTLVGNPRYEVNCTGEHLRFYCACGYTWTQNTVDNYREKLEKTFHWWFKNIPPMKIKRKLW